MQWESEASGIPVPSRSGPDRKTVQRLMRRVEDLGKGRIVQVGRGCWVPGRIVRVGCGCWVLGAGRAVGGCGRWVCRPGVPDRSWRRALQVQVQAPVCVCARVGAEGARTAAAIALVSAQHPCIRLQPLPPPSIPAASAQCSARNPLNVCPVWRGCQLVGVPLGPSPASAHRPVPPPLPCAFRLTPWDTWAVVTGRCVRACVRPHACLGPAGRGTASCTSQRMSTLQSAAACGWVLLGRGRRELQTSRGRLLIA